MTGTDAHLLHPAGSEKTNGQGRYSQHVYLIDFIPFLFGFDEISLLTETLYTSPSFPALDSRAPLVWMFRKASFLSSLKQ